MGRPASLLNDPLRATGGVNRSPGAPFAAPVDGPAHLCATSSFCFHRSEPLM